VSEGILFGGYHLLGRLAAGGMAEVFLGKSLPPDRDEQLLAIKKMLPRLSEDPNFVSMFIDEARIAAGLSHPNICRITDQGHHDNQLFIAMEFIHGKDLRVLKRRARKRGEAIPARIVAYTLAKIAEALDFAHNKCNDDGQPENIVHRDVSPQNILLSYDGIPKLIDFGVAKAKHRLAQTRVGVVKGKFAYMSPEQATGQDLDARTDIFALGVVLYELLTGRLPFKGGSDLSTLKRIARAEFIPPNDVNKQIPSRLTAIIEKALQRDPAARYPTAAALAGDLHRHLADERREVTESLLSSYLRRLFRDDYIREMARIKAFLETVPPGDAVAEAEPSAVTDPLGQRRVSDTNTATNPEPTTVSPSQFLAAGYDDGPSSGEGSNPAQDVSETAPQAKRLRFDTREVDDAIVLLSDAELEELTNPTDLDAKTTQFSTPTEGDWDAGPTTDRERQLPSRMKAEPTPTSDDVPLTDPALADAPEGTVEFRVDDDGGFGAVPTAAMKPDHIATMLEEANRRDEEEELEVEPGDFVTETPIGGIADTSDGPPTRELDTKEVESLKQEVISTLGEQSTFDEELPETQAITIQPKSFDEDDDFDIDVDDEGHEDYEDELVAGRTIDLPPDQLPDALPALAPRTRLFTNVEVALLFLAAALGMALVMGVYVYATQFDLPPPNRPAAAVQPTNKP